MTKTILRHWENNFVLQYYGAVRKFYRVICNKSACYHFLIRLKHPSTEKIISDLFLEGKYIFPSSYTIFFQGN